MKTFLKIFFYVVAAVYPVIVFLLLVIFKLPTRIFSLVVIVMAFAFFLAATGKSSASASASASGWALASGRAASKKNLFDWRPLVSSIFLLCAGVICFFTNQAIFLKLYSVAVSATFLVTFGSTLFFEPTIIFRFAALQDKTIRGSLAEKQIEAYCRKVTIVWCVFFICNGAVAAYTAFFASDFVWSVYNGGISYILMGLLFAGEFLVRRQVQKKMPKSIPISMFTANSRADDYVMCFEDTWSGNTSVTGSASAGGEINSQGRNTSASGTACESRKTWRDFLVDTAKMRRAISAHSKSDEVILHCEDFWYFLVTFVALLQSQKKILLTQNIAESFIAEIKKPDTIFLTDQKAADSLSVATLIEDASEPTEVEIRTTPKIVAEETAIFMNTSGSTGKPKAVHQRMKEFETDNAFIISKWGNDFAKRKLISTVSQHHIYGFLFGVSLPFTCGTPFRRKRIEFPEEFEKFSDDSYMIIAVPAFLKRTIDATPSLNLREPFIFVSGGVLLPEVAAATDKLFGAWPMEVYGSTETSGIAYRQSKNGLEWTPFDNAKIWKGDDGCLRIISPYIKDKDGFATADLVDIFEDGRFLLKGRADSIVKIEEKRISLPEVESRIMQTELVQEVKVIAMEDRRQYLAAVIVFNDDGNKKFSDALAHGQKFQVNQFFHNYLMNYFENVVIPKKWRFVGAIPKDVQGKTHKSDLMAMFEKSE